MGRGIFFRADIFFIKFVGWVCLGLGVRVRMKEVKFENFIHWGFGGGGLGIRETHGRP